MEEQSGGGSTQEVDRAYGQQEAGHPLGQPQWEQLWDCLSCLPL
jgi:hypothetical protein